MTNNDGVLVCTIGAYPDAVQAERNMWPLIRSCEKLGVTLTTFQSLQAWHNFYINKVEAFLHSLEQLSNKPDYVLYMDGSDTLLLEHPRVVPSLLGFYVTDFLMGAETVCWPWPQLHSKKLSPRASGFRYPQAGVWCATYKAAIRELTSLRDMVRASNGGYEEGGWRFNNEDQCGWTQQIIDGRPIKIDHEAVLVLNLNNTPEDKYDLRPGARQVVCKSTNSRPLSLHWAGGIRSKRALRDFAHAFLNV